MLDNKIVRKSQSSREFLIHVLIQLSNIIKYFLTMAAFLVSCLCLLWISKWFLIVVILGKASTHKLHWKSIFSGFILILSKLHYDHWLCVSSTCLQLDTHIHIVPAGSFMAAESTIPNRIFVLVKYLTFKLKTHKPVSNQHFFHNFNLQYYVSKFPHDPWLWVLPTCSKLRLIFTYVALDPFSLME